MKPNASILIVDDSESNRQTLETLLDEPGLELHTAIDGPSALATAARVQPDLILLDVMMPGMDGFEVCAQLRANPLLADVPVILVTSLDDRVSRLRGIEAGADDFVNKPFDGVELRARVRGVLRLNRFRRMQQAHERIEEQAALIDLSPDAIIVCDLEQRITHWNPAAEKLYGWPAAEAVERRVDELLAPADSAESASLETFADDTWRREVLHNTRDGHEVFVESRRKLLHTPEGQPKAVLMINTDLTEKKRLEAQNLRTQRLESIGTLAGGIAHDLNNILGPIMMSVGLLRLQSHNPKDQELLDGLESYSERGADLVRQILAFARGTTDSKSEVQLRHLVGPIVKMLSAAFPSNIKIQTVVPGNLWPVVGNPTQLDQILMNLCVNSRDAMPEGGELSIAMENIELSESDCLKSSVSGPGSYVCVTVADTGTGMPPEVVARIFDAFFTTKPEGKGTGLGLATVQTLVKGHGGFLTVDSQPGRGTRFKLYFPAVPVAGEASFTGASAPDLPRGNGECILVVEDEPGMLLMVSTALETFGYRTLRATDGLDALQIFNDHRMNIRIIITDTEMPQIGGVALIQILRRLDPKIPIFLMSGTDSVDRAALGAHVKEFLKKPFTSVDLIQAVHRTLAEPEAA